MKIYEGKVAVVTGAGSGIGRALAAELAGRGVSLALSDIDTAGLADTATRCERIGAPVQQYRLDVADRDAVYRHADEVREDFGGVDLVINNAGVALGAEVAEMSWADFEWLMNIDFWGVVHGTKAFLPDLIASGDGHIANLSSVFGFVGVPTQSAYCAAKFAVRGFTESLRQEMRIAGHPVGVTSVHPGGIKTNIAVNARGNDGLDLEQVRTSFEKSAWTDAESAAKTILKGVEKNKPRVLIGADARLFDVVARVVGPRYQDIGAALARRSGKVDVRHAGAAGNASKGLV